MCGLFPIDGKSGEHNHAILTGKYSIAVSIFGGALLPIVVQIQLTINARIYRLKIDEFVFDRILSIVGLAKKFVLKDLQRFASAS